MSLRMRPHEPSLLSGSVGCQAEETRPSRASAQSSARLLSALPWATWPSGGRPTFLSHAHATFTPVSAPKTRPSRGLQGPTSGTDCAWLEGVPEGHRQVENAVGSCSTCSGPGAWVGRGLRKADGSPPAPITFSPRDRLPPRGAQNGNKSKGAAFSPGRASVISNAHAPRRLLRVAGQACTASSSPHPGSRPHGSAPPEATAEPGPGRPRTGNTPQQWAEPPNCRPPSAAGRREAP